MHEKASEFCQTYLSFHCPWPSTLQGTVSKSLTWSHTEEIFLRAFSTATSEALQHTTLAVLQPSLMPRDICQSSMCLHPDVHLGLGRVRHLVAIKMNSCQRAQLAQFHGTAEALHIWAWHSVASKFYIWIFHQHVTERIPKCVVLSCELKPESDKVVGLDCMVTTCRT